MRVTCAILAGFLLWAAAPALAQSATPFGGLKHDSSQQVEVSADSLRVDQASGSATFSGNVVVGQGTLRLAADTITVFYGGGDGRDTVSRLEASGNVTLTNGAEAAEARTAVYDVGTGMVSMTGDVLLTQDGNALSGQELAIDLNEGTAEMKGRVSSILRPPKKAEE